MVKNAKNFCFVSYLWSTIITVTVVCHKTLMGIFSLTLCSCWGIIVETSCLVGVKEL